MPQRTLLLFDVDGTLVYSERRDSQCFAKAYENIYQQTFPSLDWRDFPHVTDHIIFGSCIQQHFGRSYTREEEEHFRSLYMDLLRAERNRDPDAFREVPGAGAFWRKLEKHPEYEVAIATGGWCAPAQIKLTHVGIDPSELIICGGDKRETRDDILQAAIDTATVRAGHSFDRIVYIGDAEWDARTTARMGLDFVGVRHRGDYEVLEQFGTRSIIRNYLQPDTFWAAVEQASPPYVKVR